MEANCRGKTNVYGPVVTDTKAVGKRTLEWDLNDWKWDGDLFIASPSNPTPSDCRSRQLFPLGRDIPGNANVCSSSLFCPEEINPNNGKGERELEKRRRIVVVQDEELNDEAEPVNLELGVQVYPIVEGESDRWEEKCGKKTKLSGSISNHPVCQVEDCRADLSNAKDYHRRHKVCEMHSKASKALVGNAMQRFCQQCSRFHVLQEFDEGKRSCRRRLAGHNKRRRKTHPETPVNVGSLIDEKSAGYLLISLLRILSNLQTNRSDQSKDQDLLSHLLRNIAGPLNGSNVSGLMQGSQGLLNVGTSFGIPEKEPARTQEQFEAAPSTKAHKGLSMQQTAPTAISRLHPKGDCMPAKEIANGERYVLSDIDLNNVCNDLLDCESEQEKGLASVAYPFWSEHNGQYLGPPQTSRNSDSTSGQSSSSGGEAQSRTDRIVFKLFGKDPNDLPQLLRTQILDWLSHSPSDIEGYIRPGCIVLTIYLRLTESLWEEFCYDMSASLSRLLDVSHDPFWKTGWIYTRVQQRAAFICDGQVVLDTPLPFKSRRSRISSVSPLAVPAAETVKLVVRGSNLCGPSSRLLCAIEGRYLFQQNCYGLLEGANTAAEQNEIQILSFDFSTPNVIGRGFIEVEDYGLSGCFFPFIVVEPEICSEICTLERVVEAVDMDDGIEGEHDKIEARNLALDFIHEMGWLLHRNSLRFKLGNAPPGLDLFPFERLKWLVVFSMDHDWCAVVRKLLDLLFSGNVDAGGHASIEQALSEMALLHAAVQRNSRPMVELLLRYKPRKVKNTSDQEQGRPDYGAPSTFLFRPDIAVAGGLTSLHIAASCEGSEDVLEALLEDPGMVGLGAWKNARDTTGLTPCDYASFRGHYSYIHLFQKKVDNKSSIGHVLVDIRSVTNLKSNQNQTEKLKFDKLSSLYTEKFLAQRSCKLCKQEPDYGYRGAALACRPAVLSLVAIAVVCVCTALLFKSMPRVSCIFGPFRWDSLKYGAM